jgi:hypothetical protein
MSVKIKKNDKHDSSMKYISQLLGTLVKDIENVILEIEQDSYDSGYEDGIKQGEKESEFKRGNR